MFVARFANPASVVTVFEGLSGGSTSTILGAAAGLMALPAATTCTFNALHVAGTITANAASNTLTFTLIKNGSATALTTQITASTLNTTVTSSDTTAGHGFTVAADDAIAIQLVQTNGAPTVQLSVTTQCQ
jgi:hypothetical protein